MNLSNEREIIKMTFQEFCDISYEIDKETNYYCYCYATTSKNSPRFEEIEKKYKYYQELSKKLHDFKKKVLTNAVKNLSKDFFKIP